MRVGKAGVGVRGGVSRPAVGWRLLKGHQAAVFEFEFAAGFGVGGVGGDAVHGADFDALAGCKVPDAVGAPGPVD